MPSIVPKFQDQNGIYYSDTCQPLVSAWKNGKVMFGAWARQNYPATYKMKSGVLPNMSSVGYWDANFNQDWGLDWHRNEGIEITFLETGSTPFSIEGYDYMLKPNELTITRPWQLHKVGNPNIGIGKLYWIILDVGIRYPHQEWSWPKWINLTTKDIKELTKILRQNEQPVWKATPEIKRCFHHIGSLIANDLLGKKESWIAIYINELLLHLLELFRNSHYQLDENLVKDNRTVQLFIKDLREKYHELWTLNSMAEYCGLGVTRFVHYVKQYTNLTPVNLLIQIRLEAAAKSLLHDRRKGINEICYECGFSSPQYFSTLFKKQYNCSPSAYRQFQLKE